MHLFLQICGVAGFALLGSTIIGIQAIKYFDVRVDINTKEVILDKVSLKASLSIALISTYFIFG